MKRFPRYLIALTLGLSLALVLTWLSSGHLPAARAATYVVCPSAGPGCDYTTIQAAVNAAASGDVISITTGTYTENVNITGKTLTFLGAGMGNTIVDGGSTGRVFSSDSDIALASLAIQNGSTTASEGGGGLYASAAVTLINVAVLSNTASLSPIHPNGPAGGVYAGRAATVSDSLFRNNRAGSTGGGLYAYDALTLTGTQFISNTASGNCGGAYAINALTLTNTQFLTNTAANSGGGAGSFGAVTVSGGLFQNNIASVGWGGGLYLHDTLVLTGTQFVGNAARNGGGGVAHFNYSPRLVNALFARNSSDGSGSAIYLSLISTSKVVLLHTTIASPTVGAGAAIYVDGGTVNITNTLIANYVTSLQRASGIVNSDYNLFYNAPTAVVTGTHSLTGTNPLFVNPAGNDYHLLSSSPALSAGVNVGVATDLDGNPRTDPPTIGAYEWASLVITPSADAGGSITPGTPQTVSYGGSATFTITADSGYQISDVGVDGASVGALSTTVTTTYTFNNVTANHTITAAFDLLPPATYTLTVNTSGPGEVMRAPSQTTYLSGTVVTLTAVPAAGWYLAQWSGDASGALTQTSVTMNANKAVTATFAQSSSCLPVSGPSLTYAPPLPWVGQMVTFTGTVVAGTAPITYTWNWGDGSPDLRGLGNLEGLVVTHAFPLTVTAQSYTVTLSVSNACSGPVSAAQVVAVTPRRIFLPLVLR